MEPIATIAIYDPSEVADEDLDLLSAEKICSLRVNELVELGAAYKAWRDHHRNRADDYHAALILCAEALKDKGLTESYTTENGAKVDIRQYAIFSHK